MNLDLNLNKWNPFKFARKTPDEKRHSEATRHGALTASGGPLGGSWPDASRLSMDPFHMMNELMRDPFAGLASLDRWFGDFSTSAFQPRMDVIDDGEALRVTAELPGMDRQDVELSIEDGVLALRGEKKLESKSEEKGCYRLERSFGSFQRLIPLPSDVDTQHAQASFDKGTLTVRLPKTAPDKKSSKRIEIR